jgi:hypothetical protein
MKTLTAIHCWRCHVLLDSNLSSSVKGMRANRNQWLNEANRSPRTDTVAVVRLRRFVKGPIMKTWGNDDNLTDI